MAAQRKGDPRPDAQHQRHEGIGPDGDDDLQASGVEPESNAITESPAASAQMTSEPTASNAR